MAPTASLPNGDDGVLVNGGPEESADEDVPTAPADPTDPPVDPEKPVNPA